MAHNIYKTIQQIITSMIFPVKQQDWYRRYSGEDTNERFKNFLRINHQGIISQSEKGYYNKEFAKIETIERHFIKTELSSNNQVAIDTIKFIPKNVEDKPGKGAHIINFFGVGEYYECNFRDMAEQADVSGATIHAFNPPGMNSSNGKVTEFNDIVNSGIAVINDLLTQGIHPKDIVLQGNCLGAAVAEAVNKQFVENDIRLRRINSNSFKSISLMISACYTKGLFKPLIKKLLQYTGWELKPGKDFKRTTPFSAYMHRKDDQTITDKIKLHSKLEKYKQQEESDNIGDEYFDYKDDRKFLDDHALMTVKEQYKEEKINPHELDLYKMQSDYDRNMSSHDFINHYLRRSGNWIERHPEVYQSYDNSNPKQVSYLKAHTVKNEDINEWQLLNGAIFLKEQISGNENLHIQKRSQKEEPLLNYTQRNKNINER